MPLAIRHAIVNVYHEPLQLFNFREVSIEEVRKTADAFVCQESGSRPATNSTCNSGNSEGRQLKIGNGTLCEKFLAMPLYIFAAFFV